MGRGWFPLRVLVLPRLPLLQHCNLLRSFDFFKNSSLVEEPDIGLGAGQVFGLIGLF